MHYGSRNGKTGRSHAGHAGHAGAEGAGARGQTRLRGCGMDSRELERCAARGRGRVVSGTASAGVAGTARGGMGQFGKQSARQVLFVDGGRAERISARGGVLAANVWSDREGDANGLSGSGSDWKNGIGTLGTRTIWRNCHENVGEGKGAFSSEAVRAGFG